MDNQLEAREARLAQEPLRQAGPTSGFLRGSRESVRDVWTYRELLGLLVRREIKARYKDSTLGFFWSLARPLAMLFVYWIAIGKFLEAERHIPAFAVFVFTGLTAWQFFSDIVIQGTGSIVANSGLIKKVYVPREVFPLSVVGSAAFNFLIQLVVLTVFTVILGEFPTGSRWLYLVLGTLVLVVFGTALALLLSALNVFLRDIQYLVEIAFMILFWASPVVYSWSLVSGPLSGPLLQAYLLNPMTQVILAFQQTFWVAGDDQPFPPNLTEHLLGTLGVSLVLLWVSQRVFARLQSNFAQEL